MKKVTLATAVTWCLLMTQGKRADPFNVALPKGIFAFPGWRPSTEPCLLQGAALSHSGKAPRATPDRPSPGLPPSILSMEVDFHLNKPNAQSPLCLHIMSQVLSQPMFKSPNLIPRVSDDFHQPA